MTNPLALNGRLFVGGRLLEAKVLGRLLNNPVSRVGAYWRVGAYSRDALNLSITVVIEKAHQLQSKKVVPIFLVSKNTFMVESMPHLVIFPIERLEMSI